MFTDHHPIIQSLTNLPRTSYSSASSAACMFSFRYKTCCICESETPPTDALLTFAHTYAQMLLNRQAQTLGLAIGGHPCGSRPFPQSQTACLAPCAGHLVIDKQEREGALRSWLVPAHSHGIDSQHRTAHEHVMGKAGKRDWNLIASCGLG